MLLENMTWPEVRRLEIAEMIVILPTGSFEQHGPHLLFTVDTDLVSAVAIGVERNLPNQILLLPTLPVGMSTHHNAFPGTLDVPQDTYMRLIRDMANSISRMGAKKLFILNGHGGNDVPIRAAMREIKSDHPALRTVFASYWQLAADPIKKIRTSEIGGLGHACELETSLMLHLHPAKVRMDLAKRDGPPHQDPLRKADMQFPRPIYFVNEFHEISQSGTVGHPDLATPQKGQQFLTAIINSVTDFIQQFLTWEQEKEPPIDTDKHR